MTRGFLRADLAGHEFLGVHTRRGPGPHFIIQSIEGWDDGLDMRRDQADRPTSHGAFWSPGYLSPRTVTLAGVCIAGSPSATSNAGRKFRGLLADGGEWPLTVTDSLGVLTANVARTAQPTFAVRGYAAEVADFELTLWAPDPRQYGEPRTFKGGSVVVPWHRGNFPATPVVTVTGSFPRGYRLTYRGAAYIVSSLAAGREHRIDMRTGWLYENDVIKPGAVTRAEPFTIPQGRQAEELALTPVSSGSGNVTVTLRDTYV